MLSHDAQRATPRSFFLTITVLALGASSECVTQADAACTLAALNTSLIHLH